MIEDRLKGHKISSLEVLDLGCGNYKGQHGQEMKALPFKKLVAVDRVPRYIRGLNQMTDVAAKQFTPLVREISTWLPEVKNNSYDFVIAMYSLGAPPDKDLVKHCERISRKGTIIIPEPDSKPIKKPLFLEDDDELRQKAYTKEDVFYNQEVESEASKVPAGTEETSEEEEGEDEEESDPSVKSILVERRDVHGDVLVATSVLPGLKKKYPNAEICFLTTKRYGTAVENNPYIDKIYYRKVKREFDLTFSIDHHMQWNAPMAEVHCRQCGVETHVPELYLTNKEIERIQNKHRGRIIVCNNAGWTSRTCPNLVKALENMTQHHDKFLQIDHGPRMSRHIEHIRPIMRDAFAIMHHSLLYIGVDTVWMHAGVALNKPMVLCMGVTGPETQLIKNATIIRPVVWTRPATPSKEHAHGIKLKPEDIQLAISTKLNDNGDIIDNQIQFGQEEKRIIQYI